MTTTSENKTQPLPHENNPESLKIVGRGSIYITFVVQMYTVCSQELIRLETISEKGPGHELTSEYTLLSSGAKKLASNCAHPSHEWKLLIVNRKRCKQLRMRQCNSISIREKSLRYNGGQSLASLYGNMQAWLYHFQSTWWKRSCINYCSRILLLFIINRALCFFSLSLHTDIHIFISHTCPYIHTYIFIHKCIHTHIYAYIFHISYHSSCGDWFQDASWIPRFTDAQHSYTK